MAEQPKFDAALALIVSDDCVRVINTQSRKRMTRAGCRHAVGMRSIAISTGLIVLLGTSTVFAQQFGENRVMFGAGGTSCGTWTQLRPAGALTPNASVPAEFGVLFMWVAGYMSGANSDSSYPDVLLGKDLAWLIGWIDNYCRANPLNNIGSAAASLIVELRSGRKQ